MAIVDACESKTNETPPFPMGWFSVSRSHELQVGEVKQVQAFDPGLDDELQHLQRLKFQEIEGLELGRLLHSEDLILPLLEGSPHGAVYLIGPARAPIGYAIVSFGWSVEFGGLDGFVDELYLRPAVRRRGIATEALLALGQRLGAAGMTAALDEGEVAGLRLFIGRGNCTQCHNGPLLTNMGFHSIGVPDPAGQPPDVGRFAGVQLALKNEFNCLGQYSDAAPETDADACEEVRFAKTMSPELMAAFKVPKKVFVVTELPRNPSGKILKRELRREYVGS